MVIQLTSRASMQGSSPSSFQARKRDTGMPSFMDLGLDVETRFRKLKEEYTYLLEEKEQWEEERATMEQKVEAERENRIAAEEAERMAHKHLKDKEDALRQAEAEAAESAADAKAAKEVARQMEEFAWEMNEFQQVKDDLDIARIQVAQAEKQAKLTEAQLRQKTDEVHRLRQLNHDLEEEKDKHWSSVQSGAVEHLHTRIKELSTECRAVACERDNEQERNRLLSVDLEKLRRKQQELQDQLRTSQRREASPARASSPFHPLSASFSSFSEATQADGQGYSP